MTQTDEPTPDEELGHEPDDVPAFPEPAPDPDEEPSHEGPA